MGREKNKWHKWSVNLNQPRFLKQMSRGWWHRRLESSGSLLVSVAGSVFIEIAFLKCNPPESKLNQALSLQKVKPFSAL